MEARNRSIKDWYGMIERGEIKLPRFQRFEAWDRYRITSLFNTIIHDLPLGITLVLEVGDQEKFVSRHLKTAPEESLNVHEQLLDGQQRLTALWRVFHDNYEKESYFVYVKAFDQYNEIDEEEEDFYADFQPRHVRSNGKRYPLWADEPRYCLYRGLIPTRLFRPGDIQSEIDEWIEDATKDQRPESDIRELERFLGFRKSISDQIKDLRSVVANYNLPYLSLPSSTDKTTALDVFINMNTNSKPLSTYDIIVAEIESAAGVFLHDMQAELDEKYPAISRYRDLSELVLSTSALLQERKPGERGVQNMDVNRMVDGWERMGAGLARMAGFLRVQGIFDEQRLPTKSILPVLGALYCDVPQGGDAQGQAEHVLQRYLWRAFFTERYEMSAESRAYADYQSLRKVILGQTKPDGSAWGIDDVPIFRDHEMISVEELVEADWPKRMSISGRGALAVSCRMGALDFSTGQQMSPDNVVNRHYHHIFPDALLKEAEIDSFLALNCALIEDRTNINIGRKDPLEYLKDRYQWADQGIVHERLNSHLIPVDELANGGYEGLEEAEKTEKLKVDFQRFLTRRAELVVKAARLLEQGHQVSAANVVST